MPSVKHLLYRPIIAATVLAGLAVVAVMAAFILLSWRNLERVHRIEDDVIRGNQLQAIDYRLQAMLTDAPDPRQLRAIRSELQRLSRERPQAIPAILKSLENPGTEQIETAVRQLQKLLARENHSERRLLNKVVADTELELNAGLLGMVILALLMLLSMWLAWRWFLYPLKRMNTLLLQLAEGRFEPIDGRGSNPPWRTLLDNYNHLVTRLAELERARRERTELLESQVRQAAGALLAQNRDLARAERLAAVGEVAAGLAHELRNPLAGILIALHNLRSECPDADIRRRFDLIIAELERLSHHLNHLLGRARHQPEPAKQFHLAKLVTETLELLRFQIPERIQLHCQIPANLQIRIAETGLRQVIINLVLNAVQALGERSGNIWIHGDAAGGQVRLSVADDGPGFPKPLLTQGIRPFASGRDGGTGLGLLMVKRFVTSLDGRLLLQPRKPRGAEVILEISCAPLC